MTAGLWLKVVVDLVGCGNRRDLYCLNILVVRDE